MDATGKVYATYRVVAFTDQDEARAGRMDVDLIRDYSTFSDIPAIVAARLGVEVGRVTIVSAVTV